MEQMSDVVDIFTDGACKGNPGVGGWGVLLRTKGKERELCGGEAYATNNRMELMAAIVALETLTRPCKVRLYTDSKYVLQGITEWLPGWKQRGWNSVTNKDLWQQLDNAVKRHQIKWIWVRGHSGHEGNERADALANQGVKLVLKSIKHNQSRTQDQRKSNQPKPDSRNAALFTKPCA